jgi:phosphate/sulfate permease
MVLGGVTSIFGAVTFIANLLGYPVSFNPETVGAVAAILGILIGYLRMDTNLPMK